MKITRFVNLFLNTKQFEFQEKQDFLYVSVVYLTSTHDNIMKSEQLNPILYINKMGASLVVRLADSK